MKTQVYTVRVASQGGLGDRNRGKGGGGMGSREAVKTTYSGRIRQRGYE